jgi:hypothetical protein
MRQSINAAKLDVAGTDFLRQNLSVETSCSAVSYAVDVLVSRRYCKRIALATAVARFDEFAQFVEDFNLALVVRDCADGRSLRRRAEH